MTTTISKPYAAQTFAERVARRAEVARKCGATDADYAGAKPGYAISVEDAARREQSIIEGDALRHAARMEQVDAADAAWAAARKAEFAGVATLALAHLGLPADHGCKVIDRGPYYVARPHTAHGVRSNSGVRVDKGTNVCTTIDYTGCR